MNKLLIAIILLAPAAMQAQDRERPALVNVGIGLGIDYGGLGGRLTVSPIDHILLFGALGYNIKGLGYNVGGGLRLSPQKKFCPYATAMYGYNSLVVVLIDGEYEPDLNRAFYGPTVGMGFEQRGSGKNYFNFEVLVPFRSQKFKDYKAAMEHIGAKFYTIPIDISVGYHFGF